MTPMPKSRERIHREVVSFVRRSARMTDSQTKAWQAHADRWVVSVETREASTSIATDVTIDWSAEFGRNAPLIVEIGPGTGDVLLAAAKRHPERDYLGFEVYQPAVAAMLVKLAKDDIPNVRLVMANGVEGLTTLLGSEQITELWTFFPDPWHKARHHKRRLVSAEFADLVAPRLTRQGSWRLATDWDDYADWMRHTLDGHPLLANAASGWAPRWSGRPVTKYEARGIAAGRTIRDLTYVRADAE